MKIFSLYGKTVKELTEVYKANNFKYTSYKSKQELLNGLILKLTFLELKKGRLKRAKERKDEVTKLREYHTTSGDGSSREEILAQLLAPPGQYIITDTTSEEEEEEEEEVSNEEVDNERREGLHEYVTRLMGKYESDKMDFEYFEDEFKTHMYNSHREHIMEKYGNLGKNGEKLLLHGTDEGNIQSILENDLSLNGGHAHGKVYGDGLYFTDNLEYAYKFSTDNPTKKTILICRVHIGDVIRGCPQMVRPPKMMGSSKAYDTAVNNHQKPSIFVKFKNHTYDILGVLTIYPSKNSRLNRKSARSTAMTGSGGGAPAARHPGSHGMTVGNVTVGRATVGTAKASDVMPNGVTRDGMPVGPKFKVGDEVYKIHARMHGSPTASGREPSGRPTIYTVIKVLGGGLYGNRYEISTASNVAAVVLQPLERVEEKDITSVCPRDPSRRASEGTKIATTMSVKNSIDDSTTIYYIPEGKSVYNNSLHEFKSMGSIGPGETMGLKTKIGDSFACTTMDSIIKVFKVSGAKERITVKFDL